MTDSNQGCECMHTWINVRTRRGSNQCPSADTRSNVRTRVSRRTERGQVGAGAPLSSLDRRRTRKDAGLAGWSPVCLRHLIEDHHDVAANIPVDGHGADRAIAGVTLRAPRLAITDIDDQSRRYLSADVRGTGGRVEGTRHAIGPSLNDELDHSFLHRLAERVQ